MCVCISLSLSLSLSRLPVLEVVELLGMLDPAGPQSRPPSPPSRPPSHHVPSHILITSPVTGPAKIPNHRRHAPDTTVTCLSRPSQVPVTTITSQSRRRSSPPHPRSHPSHDRRIPVTSWSRPPPHCRRAPGSRPRPRGGPQRVSPADVSCSSR